MEGIKELLENQKRLLEAQGTSQEKIEETLKALEVRMHEMEKTQYHGKVGPLPGLEAEAKNFSLQRAINAIVTGDWSRAGFEREVFQQAEKRTAMSAGSDPAGGYIVPNELLTDFIEYLRAKPVVANMGATILTGLTGVPVEIPKQTGGATAYWVGENSAITESSLTFGQIALSPKQVSGLVKLSNRLLRLSNPSVEGMIRNDLQAVLANAIDLAALRGSGASNEPIGIANTANINTVTIGTGNGGAITFDKMYDMQYELQLDNAFTGKLGYIFHPVTRRNLLQTKVAQYSGQTDGDYIIQPMVSDSQLKAWMGFDYGMSTQVPINLTTGTATTTEIYFANWAELIIGQWGGLEIMASKETSDAFEKNQTWVRIIQEVDIAVRHPESFCLINTATI
jgi:HK97 family phage major capsid protein